MGISFIDFLWHKKHIVIQLNLRKIHSADNDCDYYLHLHPTRK